MKSFRLDTKSGAKKQLLGGGIFAIIIGLFTGLWWLAGLGLIMALGGAFAEESEKSTKDKDPSEG